MLFAQIRDFNIDNASLLSFPLVCVVAFDQFRGSHLLAFLIMILAHVKVVFFFISF